MKRVLMIIAVLTISLAGCGDRETVSSDREVTDETTGETTGETTRSTAPESMQGVVDSYKIAHEEIENEGGEKEAGPYRVGYIVEPAEGWWRGDPEDLEWRAPLSGETNHIEILPFDAQTGLLVPDVEVRLTVRDENGDPVGGKPLEFYYAEFYHYANNFSLPGSGEYTLEAEISPPTFNRHGSEDGEGKVFTEPVNVTFENAEIEVEEE
jgi:hypothetical protein